MNSKWAAIASRACSHYRVETIFTPRTWQSRTYVTYVTWLARLHVRYLLFESAAERKALSPSDFSMVNVWLFWSGDGFLRICHRNIFVTFLDGGMSHKTTSGGKTQSINRRPDCMFLTSLEGLHAGFFVAQYAEVRKDRSPYNSFDWVMASFGICRWIIPSLSWPVAYTPWGHFAEEEVAYQVFLRRKTRNKLLTWLQESAEESSQRPSDFL